MKPTLMVMTTIPETMEAFLVPQLRSLDEAGFDVHVVSSPGRALDNLNVGSGIMRHAVPIERQPNPRRDMISLWRLFQVMRKVQPHIVHAHTPKAGLIGMAAAKLARIPLRLYTVHGLPLLTRTGLWRHILEAAERTSASLATHNYAVSHSVRDLLVNHNLCTGSKARVLGDGSCAGVDVSRFQPSGAGAVVRQRYGIPLDAVLLTFVGRLARDKGIAVLAEAWPQLAEEIPELQLLLAGEEDHSDPVPKSALDALRRHSRVHCIGAVAQEDMPGVYAATDICVLPTFREGFPQTALEAAASAVPMVSTRVSGVVNAIVDGLTGLLVPAMQAEPLRVAIAQLARNPEQRHALGQAARARVVAQFSQERVNQIWMAEYLGLVATKLPDLAGMLSAIELQTERPNAL